MRNNIIFLCVVQYKIRKLQIPWGHFYLTEPSYYYVELGIGILYPTASARMLKFSFTATKSQSALQTGWHYERCLIYNYPACKVIITNTVRLCPHLCNTVTLSREWMAQEKGERLITIPRQVMQLPSHPHFPEEAARERLNSSRTRLGMENRLHN